LTRELSMRDPFQRRPYARTTGRAPNLEWTFTSVIVLVFVELLANDSSDNLFTSLLGGKPCGEISHRIWALQVKNEDLKDLFGYVYICLNPRALKWIGVELN
jgi:hypothetical protein